MTLTEEQKRAYIQSKGVRCPVCRSTSISSGPLQADADIAWADVECHDCGAEWTDQYALVAVDQRPAQ